MPQNKVQPTIFIEMSCTKSGKWPLLYYSSFLFVLQFIVVFLLCRSSLIFDVFVSPSFLFVTRLCLFFSQSIYELRTAVYYCCLYLEYFINQTKSVIIVLDIATQHQVEIGSLTNIFCVCLHSKGLGSRGCRLLKQF